MADKSTKAEDQKAAAAQFREDVIDKPLLLNYEYEQNGVRHATLLDPESKEDKGKTLVADGYLLAVKRREKRFEKIVSDYLAAQEEAKKNRLNMWCYGDIRDDDDKEFGMGR